MITIDHREEELKKYITTTLSSFYDGAIKFAEEYGVFIKLDEKDRKDFLEKLLEKKCSIVIPPASQLDLAIGFIMECLIAQQSALTQKNGDPFYVEEHKIDKEIFRKSIFPKIQKISEGEEGVVINISFDYIYYMYVQNKKTIIFMNSKTFEEVS